MESLNLERGALTVREDALIGATDRWCWSMLPLFAFAWESCFAIVELCRIACFITLCFCCCNTSHVLAFPCTVLSSLLVRRSVRSTSAASRRDAERAKFKVQVPKIASKAFLKHQKPSLKGLS